MAAPPETMKSGQQKFAGRGITRCSALTAAVNIFEPTATTQEFKKKLLKWKAGVCGESKNARYLNAGGGSG